MIRVGVRLVLLAGAAATLALFARESLCRLALPRLDAPVHALSHAARTIAPRPVVASAPDAPPPFVPPIVTEAPRAELAPPKPMAKKVTPAKQQNVTHITRKELEEAIQHGLPGASALAVKDDEGKPLGLRLAGVGRLAPFGVHEGDVLVSANGHPLRNADEALSALGALEHATHVVVAFRRGATAFSIPVDLVD